MRSLSSELSNHFKSEVTTLATCWKLIRTGGIILDFTDHDRSLLIEGLEYDSIAGFTPTNVESGCNLAVEGKEQLGVIHCYSGTKKVVEHLLSSTWSRMLVGVYRFKQKN